MGRALLRMPGSASRGKEIEMKPTHRMENEVVRRRWFRTVREAREYAETLAMRCGIEKFESHYDGGSSDRRCKQREWTVPGYIIEQHVKYVAIFKRNNNAQ